MLSIISFGKQNENRIRRAYLSNTDENGKDDAEKDSAKKSTKISATTPLSRSLAKQGSTGGTFEVRTAAADNLDDILSVAQKNQDVKPFIEILSIFMKV